MRFFPFSFVFSLLNFFSLLSGKKKQGVFTKMAATTNQPELNEETRKEIMEFQSLQQQAQYTAMQKQQFALHLADIEKALEEVKTSQGQCFRYAGSVIVPKDKETLEKELADEKESLQLRQSIINKQEAKIKERLEAIAKKFEGPQTHDSHSHSHKKAN